MGPWKAGCPRLDSYPSGSSIFSVEESRLWFHTDQHEHTRGQKTANNLQAKETSLLGGSGVARLVHKGKHSDRDFSWVRSEETLSTDRNTPHDSSFSFFTILWACSRDYNCCVLLCICYYKSNNGRSSPTEPALCSILLWVWCIGSNYGYKGESWQTWLKMDAKIQLSVV